MNLNFSLEIDTSYMHLSQQSRNRLSRRFKEEFEIQDAQPAKYEL